MFSTLIFALDGFYRFRCTRVGPDASHSCFQAAANHASLDRSSGMTLSISTKIGCCNTGVGLRQPDMVRREPLVATSTVLTCGLLFQTEAWYSTAENTRARVEIRSILAAPQCSVFDSYLFCSFAFDFYAPP